MKLAAPKTIRGLMDIFLTYRSEVGLKSILDAVEWRGVLPVQVYYAVLNRIPENALAAMPSPHFVARDIFEGALKSYEFQASIVALLLAAYADKRRLIFVPTAQFDGADLIGRLACRHPHIYQSLADPAWTSKDQLFGYLRDLSLTLRDSEAVFFSGPMDLTTCLETRTYRLDDEIFAVLEDPVARVLETVNHVVGVLCDTSEPMRPDRQAWLQALGGKAAGSRPTRKTLGRLARRVLWTPQIISPNAMCKALGRGDAASALDAIVRSNIEIADARRYGAWLRSRWGLDPRETPDPSRPVLTIEDLTGDELDHIRAISAEDLVLYDLISERLARSGAPSLRGLALAGCRAPTAAATRANARASASPTAAGAFSCPG